ncbi:MAG: nuclear transport factor 2 family protein [Erythrobacter sp.]|uniref:nuclear transport factor 2 family protein n=1 Tax=Erythrobacter sp. TaxID=1042 RepID=UPI002601942D|nr:nuclear transport factor 2 family protein [Erythrobacter sp.]MDJ0979944.1 nuclear transport factor 2 family protein [Erythrobacter sp.]
MTAQATSTLSAEHREFYERFKSFWANPTGPRVAEIIAPDATIHFSGQGTFSGAEYVEVMSGLLDQMDGLEVTAIDCAGEGELLYIFWNASALIDGEPRPYHGVDRFRIRDGMAREEYIIFDTSLLA